MAEQRSKAVLIERYHDINVEDGDWYTCIVDRWRTTLEAQGWSVHERKWFRFSGFFSQGDGASFVGELGIDNVAQFVCAWGYAAHFPALIQWANRQPEVQATFVLRPSHASHYCRENSVEADLEVDGLLMQDDDEVLYAVLRIHADKVNVELYTLEKWLLEAAQENMRAIYAELREEYEYLTSDDQVWESILANDLDTNTAT